MFAWLNKVYVTKEQEPGGFHEEDYQFLKHRLDGTNCILSE